MPLAPPTTASDRLLALTRLAETTILSVSIADVFRQSLDSLGKVIPHDRASIAMFDTDGVMRFKAWRHVSPEFRRAMQWMGTGARSLWSSEPVVVSPTSEGPESDELRGLFLGEGIHAAALFSIGAGGSPLGKLMIARNDPSEFTPSEILAGRALAAEIALAYDLVRTRHALHRSRLEDDQAGLFAARGLAERRLAAEHAVTQILSASDTLGEAVPRILESMGECLACVFGAFWQVQPGSNVIRCTETWQAWSSVSQRFDSLTRDIALERGIGLPGRVWLNGSSAWVADLAADHNFPRLRVAASAGLRTGFAFPVRIEERMLGVMEFFLPQRSDADPHLLEMLTAVGSEIGQFIKRKEVEAELEKSERRFRTMAEAMPEILFTHTADGTQDYRSARYYEYTGITRREDDLEERLEAIHPDDREPSAAAWARALQSRTVCEIEYRLRGKDGVYRWFHARSAPIFDAEGRVTKWIGVSTEIDEQKRIEERLKEANQAKDDFLAMLAHELRNPLNPIRSSVHVMRQVGIRDVVLDRARDIIDRQVSHMARLIDDLLDVSRISRGKILLRRERVDLNALVRTTFEDHRAEIEGSAQTAILDLPEEPLWVSGDVTRLAQITGNLLQNANKFTDAGGTILVRARCEPEARQVVLTVRDSGIGLEPQMLDRVFETFTQADRSLEHRGGGLGLGLALVKGLVALHGGSVHARSEGLGRGAEFSIRLPLSTEPATPPPAPNSASPPATPCRVLVIEDHADSGEGMKLSLQLSGHVVELARTGAEGVELARSFAPDVVLCDVGLAGGMDGYAVARALRADPDFAACYLVAVTGYGREEDVERSRSAGFDRHLTKPIDLRNLDTVLREIAARLPAIRG